MAAPTSVRVEAIAMTSTILRWVYGGANNLAIHRSTNGTTYSLVATVGSTTTSYTDTGLAEGTKYWYKITDDGGTTFSSVVTVFTHTCPSEGGGISDFALPRFGGSEQQSEELNDLATRIEAALGENVISPDACIACPTDGAVILDCNSGCTDFVIIADQDINSITVNWCDAPPEIEVVVPPNVTRQICGFPREFGFGGDECFEAPIVGGSNGKVVSSSGSSSQGNSPKKSSNAGGGGGGAGGTDCQCVPGTNKALTIKCCTANCGMTCGSTKKLQLKACGGAPGIYSWTKTGTVKFTGKTSDGVGGAASDTASSRSGETASVEPPANTGSAEAGDAYYTYTRSCQSGPQNSARRATYGCNDQILVACADVTAFGCGLTYCNITESGCDGDSVTICSACGGLGLHAYSSGSPCSQCGAGSGVMCDVRTAPMIAAGCSPCGVSAGGQVVTVTDAGGNAVSITLNP